MSMTSTMLNPELQRVLDLIVDYHRSQLLAFQKNTARKCSRASKDNPGSASNARNRLCLVETSHASGGGALKGSHGY